MRFYRLIALLLLLTVSVKTVYAGATTDDLFSAASAGVSNPECLEYCVTGICISIICTPYGCTLDYSTLVSHRSPDLVVSSYKEPGENSWDDAKSIFGSAAKGAANSFVNFAGLETSGGPNYTSRQSGNTDQQGTKEGQAHAFSNLHFKETSVIGSPTTYVTDQISGSCPAESEEYRPYYQSEFDAFEWRWGLLEKFYASSWIPGLQEISQTPFTTWGGLHPRMGFIKSEHPARAAAVAAQRSVDIMTKKRQPHVYYLQNRPDGPTFPSDYKVDKWQMVYPEMDNTCYTFGSATDYVTQRVDRNEEYVFLYWQRLECCPYAKGVVIAKIRAQDMCN